MRIVIATVRVPFVRGGAEVLADGLEAALKREGHEVETIYVPFKWYPPERIPDHLLVCRLFDLTESSGVKIDLMIGLKFPAFHIPHSNKVLWIIHQHRQAYDLWDRPEGSDLRAHPGGPEVCAAVRQADKVLLPEAKKIFTIAGNVSRRLKHFCGIDSQPLYHPPLGAESFLCGEFRDYFFYPSRINPMKRQQLVIEALARTKNPIRLKFAGTPEYPPDLDKLKDSTRHLGLSKRVEWLGAISHEAKIYEYSHALGVVFPPVDEDYGYVTLEAMLSAKPVITCRDSGGPNEFVVPGTTGYSSEPTPEALAEAMDTLWENRNQAVRMGQAARARYAELNISWSHVTQSLTS